MSSGIREGRREIATHRDQVQCDAAKQAEGDAWTTKMVEVAAVETLNPPSLSRSESGRTFVRGLECFVRLACWRTEDDEEAAPLRPKAKAKPPGPAPARAKAKSKAPPAPKGKAKALSRRSGSANANVWKGPAPSEGLKSQRVVNWNPIRQDRLLEGSVWQRVNNSIETRGHGLLPQEELNKAFMRSVTTPKAKSGASASRGQERVKKKVKKKEERRVLQPKAAFMADVLYAQLAKKGLADVQQLHWLGIPKQKKPGDADSDSSSSDSDSYGGLTDSESSSSSSEESDSEASASDGESSEPEPEKPDNSLTEDSLQTLLTFLRLAEGNEDMLQKGDASQLPLAAPERLLSQLLHKVGPAPILRSRVQATLIMTCFPRESDELERKLRKGLDAARAVVTSSSIPVFLEGVLLLGNYVNSSSQTLGSATGVALDSITKLAHTRALESEHQVNNRGYVKKPRNALILLVDHLEKTQEPTWLKTLTYELGMCRAACDSDVSNTSSGFKDLAANLKVIEECFQTMKGYEDGGNPASMEARFKRFKVYATPRLEELKKLEEDLQKEAQSMRKYFAEPGSTSLTHMLRSLASLLDLLPAAAEPSPRGIRQSEPPSQTLESQAPDASISSPPAKTVVNSSTGGDVSDDIKAPQAAQSIDSCFHHPEDTCVVLDCGPPS